MNKKPSPDDSTDRNARRNFFSFVLNMISLRVGWIFKTESIIMPGFLDTLTSSGAIRGFLPLISRIGQSLPQFVIAHRATNWPRKKWAFFHVSLLLCVPWGVLALAVRIMSEKNTYFMVGVFLTMYAFHWVIYGITTLLSGTLQGKLIAAQRRGRLLAISSFCGCALAIGAVYVSLPRWLKNGDERYELVFGATCLFFAISAFTILALREYADAPNNEMTRFREFAVASASLIGRNIAFRRFIVVICLYYVTMLLFPHYTVFGKRTMNIQSGDFMPLLIAQNFVNATGSVSMGLLADRYGNRIVLRLLICIAGCVPLIAIGISKLPLDVANQWYWIVFALIGFTPVSGRIITNYTLEIAPKEQHPQYLGTLTVIQMLPISASPLIGWLIDQYSFQLVFVICSMVIFVGAALTARLEEPRKINQNTYL